MFHDDGNTIRFLIIRPMDIFFRFIALINGFIGFGALYGVAGMVALFGGADVVTSGFSAGEPYPPRLHVKPPSNKLSMLYHHTKVRIPLFPITVQLFCLRGF